MGKKKLGRGRPTSCTDEVIRIALEYPENFNSYGHQVPSVVGLCKVINRSRSRVYEWAENDDGIFRDILDAINESQELVTMNKGLTGDFNATIAKLVLANHGFHDKQSSEISGPGGSPVEIDQEWRVTVVEP